MKIMVVDDELVVRESLFHWFSREGYYVMTAASGEDALEKLEKDNFSTMFVDMKMPGMGGFELLEKVNEYYPETAVIIITAYGSIDTAVKAMKAGASDYLLKPFKPDQLSLVMEKIAGQRRRESEYRYLKGQIEKINRFDNIIGESKQMNEIYKLITEVADTDTPVLILGETGTGKELVARAIHAKSHRKNFPFVPINCGALPDTLLESELFGYRKGAFTGANQNRKGFLEVVEGGTLFLDEIGEISPRMQVSLLRVLQDKKINPLGDTRQIDVNFRLVSATRQNLQKEIETSTFRNDFFYRINVITMEIPPLRKRKADIPLLAEHFIYKYNQETAKQVGSLDKKAVNFLKEYEWPGNVRELENAVERAVVLAKSRVLTKQDFLFLNQAGTDSKNSTPKTLKEMEKEHVKIILEEHDWNISHAALTLDISRGTLHRMIKRHQLEKH